MEFGAAHAAMDDVSRETFERLECYASMLERWNRKINLVGATTIGDLWSRHILDSLQLLPLAPSGERLWADLGSGGGLPGVVLAIRAKEQAPQARFVFVEADQRKAAFLRSVNRELELGASVISTRLEALDPLGADCITARALAPLKDLLEYMMRHGARGCVGLFPKGERAEGEIAEALEGWSFTCERFPSATARKSLVLRIGDLKRA